MDLAHFCMILLTAEKELKAKDKTPTKEPVQNTMISQKIKGSQISGPFDLKIEITQSHLFYNLNTNNKSLSNN